MKKRYRKPVAKDGELLVRYGKEYGDEDLFYCYPDNECGMKRDSKMLMLAFERTVIFQEDGRTLRQELEARGYDITTLKFSVMKKQPNAEMDDRDSPPDWPEAILESAQARPDAEKPKGKVFDLIHEFAASRCVVREEGSPTH